MWGGAPESGLKGFRAQDLSKKLWLASACYLNVFVFAGAVFVQERVCELVKLHPQKL